MKIPGIQISRHDDGRYIAAIGRDGLEADDVDCEYDGIDEYKISAIAIAILAYLHINHDLEVLTVDGKEVYVSELNGAKKR